MPRRVVQPQTSGISSGNVRHHPFSQLILHLQACSKRQLFLKFAQTILKSSISQIQQFSNGAILKSSISQIKHFSNGAILKSNISQMEQFPNEAILKSSNSQMNHFGVATLCHISRSHEQRNMACDVLIIVDPVGGQVCSAQGPLQVVSKLSLSYPKVIPRLSQSYLKVVSELPQDNQLGSVVRPGLFCPGTTTSGSWLSLSQNNESVRLCGI